MAFLYATCIIIVTTAKMVMHVIMVIVRIMVTMVWHAICMTMTTITVLPCCKHNLGLEVA